MSGTNPEIIESMDQSIFKGSYPIDEKILLLNFDKLVESDAIKIIPVLRTIIAVYKGVLGIKDRFFIKKVVLFINQFNLGLSTPEIQKFVSDVLTNEKFRQKVNEKILILLDRFDDEFKALILAELIKNWIKRNIDWNTFERLAYSVERAHPSVFFVIYDYYKNFKSSDPAVFTSIGDGIYPQYKPLVIGSGLGNISGTISRLIVSQDALDICEYGMKKLLDDQYEIFPRDVMDYLQKEAGEKREKLLNDPIFSGYEQWIVELGATTSTSNFKIRKEIFDKIRKFYSV
jgi:hypothetical protein